jgi:hypothetical protein
MWYRFGMAKAFEDRKVSALEDIVELLKEISEEGKCVCKQLHDIRWLLHEFLFPVPTSLTIIQLGGSMSTTPITNPGVVVGTTALFGEVPSAPPNAVEPAGTTRVWTTSDPTNTALTPSSNGSQVNVAVAATAPVGGSFVLTATDTFPDSTTATGSLTVPYLPVPAPEPTALSVVQLTQPT